MFHEDHNTTPYIQQAANAAINGAIGSSGYGTPLVSRKRKDHQLRFAIGAKDEANHMIAQGQKVLMSLEYKISMYDVSEYLLVNYCRDSSTYMIVL